MKHYYLFQYQESKHGCLTLEQLNNGIKINKKDKIKNAFDKKTTNILLDYVKEFGIVKIISNYCHKFYKCYHCNRICNEKEIIFYNRGASVITECSNCA